MRLLAIETSGFAGSIAVADADRVHAETPIDPGRRHTQTLIPTLRDTLASVGWSARDVEVIAVSIGPGSYTGLRVGVTCAKTLAYAVAAKVVAVDTLEAIAAAAPADAEHLCVIGDAQRRDVYRAEFHRPGPGQPMRVVKPTAIEPLQAWAASLPEGVFVCGPALRKWRADVPARALVLPECYWEPRAAVVAALGRVRHLAGEHEDFWKLQPRYFRPSAAEEKWDARATHAVQAP